LSKVEKRKGWVPACAEMTYGEEFKELVNLLKTKYTKRPAFLDEMKYV